MKFIPTSMQDSHIKIVKTRKIIIGESKAITVTPAIQKKMDKIGKLLSYKR